MTITELVRLLQKLPVSMKDCEIKVLVNNNYEDLSDVIYSPRNNEVLLVDYLYDE